MKKRESFFFLTGERKKKRRKFVVFVSQKKWKAGGYSWRSSALLCVCVLPPAVLQLDLCGNNLCVVTFLGLFWLKSSCGKGKKRKAKCYITEGAEERERRRK